jgi:heme ABC exporter ATP-binding subunit CcmA
MMDAPPIEARGLDKSFGAIPVLRGVNLVVAAGRGVMIIGRNGAGKSTLVRILAGLSTSTAGEALLFGRASRELDPALRRRVGLLTHQSFLYPNLTARENLEFYAKVYGLDGSRGGARSDIMRWLERVGLAAAANERVRTFSRGMEQRLALARAMLHAPGVLLMDEPFAALDTDGVVLAATLIREALERGCAIALTAHEPLKLEGITLDLVEIVRGRLVNHKADAIPAPILRHGLGQARG